MRTRVIFLSVGLDAALTNTGTERGPQMIHLGWKEAAGLFEDLAEQGLNTASAVERAYEKDPALVWRFMYTINITHAVVRKMWANFAQLIASSDHYKPLFKTWRVRVPYTLWANLVDTSFRTMPGLHISIPTCQKYKSAYGRGHTPR